MSLTYSPCHDGDCDYVVTVNIPNGIAIKRNSFGYGLFATKKFLRGEVLYSDSCFHVQDDGYNKTVKVVTNDGVYFVQTHVHAVKVGNLYRVYSFDSFINHCCDPNSFSVDDEESEAFVTIACKDIDKGQEITTDYDCFIFDYGGIPNCHCYSDNCRGRSYGFRYIPLKDQFQLLPNVHPDVIAVWQKYTPCVKVQYFHLPSMLALQRIDFKKETEDCRDGLALVAKHFIAAGTLLFAAQTVHIDCSLVHHLIYLVKDSCRLSSPDSRICQVVPPPLKVEFLHCTGICRFSVLDALSLKCSGDLRQNCTCIVSPENDSVTLFATKDLKAGEYITL